MLIECPDLHIPWQWLHPQTHLFCLSCVFELFLLVLSVPALTKVVIAFVPIWLFVPETRELLRLTKLPGGDRDNLRER
jgi:hypothetical protein